MKRKFHPAIIALVLLALPLAGCYSSTSKSDTSNLDPSSTSAPLPPSSVNTSEAAKDKFTYRTAKLNSSILLAKELNVYFKNGSNAPLIDVLETIGALDGFYLLGRYTINYKNNAEAGEVKFTWTDELEHTHYMILNYKDNFIKMSSLKFTKLNGSAVPISYSEHYRLADQITVNKEQELYFDLNPYNFKIDLYDGHILMNLSLFNTLFFVPNLSSLIFNGEDLYFFNSYIGNEKYDLRIKELEGSKIPQSLKEERNNQIYFMLDYFYGLKDIIGYTNAKEFIKQNESIFAGLDSLDTTSYHKALIDLFITTLDDPHTTLGSKNFFLPTTSVEDVDIVVPEDAYNKRTATVFNTLSFLSQKYESMYEDDKLVRYEGNTATFKFDNFQSGTKDQLYNEDGTIKPDAYKHDTFFVFKQALDEISTHEEVKNVVIDLSCNGGGEIYTAYGALGFLTNEPIKVPFFDTLDKYSYIDVAKVDSDMDGDFDDQDAFDQYNYYVLVSPGTFSAANFFTSICRDMGIATIIGTTSGGGTASVGSITLIDGTGINFSNSWCMGSQTFKDGKYTISPIEDGVPTKYTIHSDDYYDLVYLNEQINNGFKN